MGQTKTAAERLNDYFNATNGRTSQTAADRDVDHLQKWLNEHHLESIKVAERGHRLVRRDPRARRRQVHGSGRDVRRGRRDLDRQGPLQHRADPRDLDLHAPRHAAAAPRGRPALPTAAGRAAAAPANRERARVVRARAGAAQPDHRRERRDRHLPPRRHRAAPARGELRADLRRVGGADRGAAVPRPVARRDSRRRLRARRAPDLDHLGDRCSSSASTRSRATSWCRT